MPTNSPPANTPTGPDRKLTTYPALGTSNNTFGADVTVVGDGHLDGDGGHVDDGSTIGGD